MGSTGPHRRDDADQAGSPRRGGSSSSGSNGRHRIGQTEQNRAAGVNGRAVGRLAEGGRQMIKRVFDIPSDFAASRDVQVLIMQDVVAAGYDEEAIFAIRISLEEAIVNAIRHGNRLDAAKRVRIESHTSPESVEILVEDEGVGFDRACVPDPTAAENLCRPSGRGILLIESYMTRVLWEKGGRRMRMLKQAQPQAAEA